MTTGGGTRDLWPTRAPPGPPPLSPPQPALRARVAAPPWFWAPSLRPPGVARVTRTERSKGPPHHCRAETAGYARAERRRPGSTTADSRGGASLLRAGQDGRGLAHEDAGLLDRLVSRVGEV